MESNEVNINLRALDAQAQIKRENENILLLSKCTFCRVNGILKLSGLILSQLEN